MAEDAEPRNSYERKLRQIITLGLRRYQGNHTPEDYQVEHQVAENILEHLGVRP